MLNGKIRPSGTTEWKPIQYQPKNNFRIQITNPDDVIREIAGANVQVKVQVELEGGIVKNGLADQTGSVSLYAGTG